VPDNVPFHGERTPPLILVAAWLVNGKIPIERVPWWAAEMLARGHDGSVLRELAGLGVSDVHAIRDLLPDALAEQGIHLPTDDIAAAIMIFDELAYRLLAGEVGPRWVAQAVDDEIIRSNYCDELLAQPLSELHVHGDWICEPLLSPASLDQQVRDLCVRQVELSRRRTGEVQTAQLAARRARSVFA
jgi:hypothetical protein